MTDRKARPFQTDNATDQAGRDSAPGRFIGLDLSARPDQTAEVEIRDGRFFGVRTTAGQLLRDGEPD